MRVVNVVPGTGGGFYCENCAREDEVLPALARHGIDAVSAPMYLPLHAGGGEQPDRAIFFGAVNVFLQEKLPLFRVTPRWIDRIFDSRGMLRMAAARAGSTTAAGLEDLTLSMLNGERGRQAKEVRRFLRWLADEGRPDVVHLSNALLLGLAPAIKRRLGAALVCTLQDEDGWVDSMSEPGRSGVWGAMRELAAEVDMFTAVSRNYADRMRTRLGLDEARLRIIPPGIDPAGFEPAAAPPHPPAVGYLSRLSPVLGLDALAEAFLIARRAPGLQSLRLRAAGGWLASDVPFIEEVKKRLASQGALGDFEALGPLDRPGRAKMLKSVSVLSVPAPAGSAFGMFLLEAMSAGVPVVQPRSGAFPEVIEASGAGLVCEPGDASSLAGCLVRVLLEPGLKERLSARGLEAVRGRFNADRMAADLKNVYEEAIAIRASRPRQPGSSERRA